MTEQQQNEVLDALKAEKEMGERMKDGFRAANQMNHVLYSALVAARYSMMATQEWGGFADDRQVKLVPKDKEKESVVMVWGELMENIAGLLDQVADMIGGKTFESIKETDKSFDLEFEMP
jgi:hypothetical protein